MSPTRVRAAGPRRWTRLLVVPAVVVGGLTATPHPASATAKATAGAFVPVPGPVFGDPTAAHNAITDRLLDNIAHTPAGATIRIVGYSFSLGGVATALLAAHARGVHVQVVMDGHSRRWSPAKRLVPVLGTDPASDSFFVLTDGSARGTGGVTHQKSWAFSRVGDTRDVVMVGSTNLTGYGTGVQYSDVYVHTGRPDVYQAYGRVFEQQALDTAVPDPYVVTSFDGGSVSFFPRPGTAAATDPAVLRIQALPGPGTRIRVAQFAWYDTRGTWIARALAQKKAEGAVVSVVAGESVGSGVRRVLAAAGIPVWSGVYTTGKRIHCKLMLASYRDTAGFHRSIWTGSDNWANQSFRNDDDTLQVLDDTAGYGRYVRFWNELANLSFGVPSTGTPPPPGTVARPSRVYLHLSARRVHSGRPLLVFGRLGPAEGRRVLVQRHRSTSTSWHTVATTSPLRGATYRVRLHPVKRGSWRYRAVVRRTPSATRAVSAVSSVRVIR